MNRLEKEIKKSILGFANPKSRLDARKSFTRARLLVAARTTERVEALERNLGIYTQNNKEAKV